ncbi:hypothetical protein Hdeb2414_s0018g00518531 [Helianthus debilis subsp. tardiflorus]
MCCPKFPTLSYPKSYCDESVDESGFSNQVPRRFVNHGRTRFSGTTFFHLKSNQREIFSDLCFRFYDSLLHRLWCLCLRGFFLFEGCVFGFDSSWFWRILKKGWSFLFESNFLLKN